VLLYWCAPLDVKGESINDERNQEESGREEKGARQEEGRCKEEEVVAADSLKRVQKIWPRAIGAFFFLYVFAQENACF
jgi:hypothetical protein